MSTFDSESNNPRARPFSLHPTTLPHPMHDEGAGGERIFGVGGAGTANNEKWTNTPTPSTIDLVRTASQISQTQDIYRPSYYSWPKAFHISLRIAFYVLVLIVTIGLTLAACKFTNIWDPCQHLYITSTECKVTGYMKGMVYYTECIEERSCILPGFESNVKRHGWSLHKPNDTTMSTMPTPDAPVQ